MICQTCDTIWNVDWDTMTPLYSSSYNLSMDSHLNTIKDTLDYLHDTRLKYTLGPTEKLDGMIHDLTKVVRLIKELKEEHN